VIHPLTTNVCLCAIAVYAVIVACFISTLTSTSFSDVANAILDTNGTGIDLTSHLPDESYGTTISWIVHIVGIVWTMNVALGVAWVCQSGAVAQWFFSSEATQEAIPFGCGFRAVWSSHWRAVRYHVGSVAFGSAIITVCNLIRIVLATIDYYTRELQQNNLVLKVVMKCAQCCMWCMERTIQFISYHGYVFVAMEGVGFCRGCAETFKLIATYPAQATVNGTVVSLIGLIISYSTPTLCAVLAFGRLDNTSAWPVYPVGAVWLVAFVVARAFTTAFTCTVDSIFVCAFKDMQDSKPRGRHLSDGLREAFGIESAEEELRNAGQAPMRPVVKNADGTCSSVKSQGGQAHGDPETPSSRGLQMSSYA